MTQPQVILILSAGPRIGSSVARKFASQGFSVVIASRSVTDSAISPEGYLQLQVDLSRPETVPRVFEVTKSRLGVPPQVVVYNGAFRQPNSPEDPFSMSLEIVQKSMTISYESQFIAAQETLKGFEGLPSSTPKTFILTGNALNQVPLPEVFSFAAAKRAAATLIEYGANAYGPKGYRFYYVDERKALDGRPVGNNVDGEAHGEMYWKLAQPGEQQKWLVTFTKGEGRVEFGGVGWDGVPYQPKY